MTAALATAALTLSLPARHLSLGGPPPAPRRYQVWRPVSLAGLSYAFGRRPMYGRETPTRLFRPLPAATVPDPSRGLHGYGGPNAPYVPVFVYHQVAPAGWPLTHGPDTVTPAHLAAALAYLARHHDPTLTPSQFLAYLHGRLRVPAGSVFLTFDNGLEGVDRFAFPLLRRYQVHATVFLIGGRTLPNHLDGQEAPYLRWPQVERMAASGLVTFESETYSLHHRDSAGPWRTAAAVLPRQSGGASGVERESAYVHALATDFMLQRATFEQHLHYAPDLLVWPFSTFTRIALRVARAYGIRGAFVVQPGFAIPGVTALWRIPRNDVTFMDESLAADLATLARVYRHERERAAARAAVTAAG